MIYEQDKGTVFLGIMIFMATTVGVFAHPQNPSLKSLTVNGEPVEGFNKNKSVYIHEITREDCCKPIPTVEAVVDDPTSTVTITQATSLPGEARILVHAIDVYEMGYVVKFNYKRSKIKEMAPVELSVKKGLELYRAPVPQRMIVTLDSGQKPCLTPPIPLF